MSILVGKDIFTNRITKRIVEHCEEGALILCLEFCARKIYSKWLHWELAEDAVGVEAVSGQVRFLAIAESATIAEIAD